MTRKRLQELEEELAAMWRRAANIKRREMVRFAEAVGRVLDPNRDREPTYVRRGWQPLSIPGHQRTLKKGTVCKILGALEEDLHHLERELDAANGPRENGNG